MTSSSCDPSNKKAIGVIKPCVVRSSFPFIKAQCPATNLLNSFYRGSLSKRSLIHNIQCSAIQVLTPGLLQRAVGFDCLTQRPWPLNSLFSRGSHIHFKSSRHDRTLQERHRVVISVLTPADSISPEVFTTGKGALPYISVSHNKSFTGFNFTGK